MTYLKAVFAAALACSVIAPLQAGLISNGGFESGLTGWSRVDQAGSDGTFFVQTGTASPVLGLPVPAPPEGVNAAMTDAEGPGSHVLYQDFVVPTSFSNALLTFALFVGNGADEFVTPDTLDFSTVRNQQFRVDILSTTADPFSVDASDILLNAYRTQVGDPLVSGYNTVNLDVTSLLQANAGNTLRLRFAGVDNLLSLNVGVDAVDIDVDTANPVPEPSTWLLTAGVLTGLAHWRRRS